MEKNKDGEPITWPANIKWVLPDAEHFSKQHRASDEFFFQDHSLLSAKHLQSKLLTKSCEEFFARHPEIPTVSVTGITVIRFIIDSHTISDTISYLVKTWIREILSRGVIAIDDEIRNIVLYRDTIMLNEVELSPIEAIEAVLASIPTTREFETVEALNEWENKLTNIQQVTTDYFGFYFGPTPKLKKSFNRCGPTALGGSDEPHYKRLGIIIE